MPRHIPTTIATLVLYASLSWGDVVLKDHVTESTNWNGQTLIAHTYPPSVPAGAFGVTAPFTGNGHILKTVAGIFAHDSAAGVPNGGTPGSLDFRFAFFEDEASYLADPFFEVSAAPDVFHLFDNVSNTGNWLMSRGKSDDGHDLFLWEVDVESLGITTTPGQTHFASLIPETNASSGTTMLVASTGTAAIGLQEDWFASRTVGPDTLQNIGSPVPYAAYRITTVPEPSSAMLLALVAATWSWFSSRTRIRHQPRVERTRNSGSPRCT